MSLPPPHRPWLIRSTNRVGRILCSLGLNLPALNEEVLLDKARRATGLSDFGGEEFRRGLRQLLLSIEQEADLNQLGRISTHAAVMGYLKNRLMLADYRRQHPDIGDQPVSRPIFIAGLPRTGTTILFNLLAMDPTTRAPLAWEMDQPVPPPTAETYRTDPRIAQCRKQFETLDRFLPSLKTIHEFDAQWPQECVPILRHEFLCLEFNITYRVPAYHHWLLEQDIRPALSFHKKFIQHLQYHYRKERWVFKSPAHLHSMEELLEIYPDACVIHTHRDPVKVMPSLASLAYTLQGMVSDSVNAREVGQQQMQLWGESLGRAVMARDKLADRGGQFFDVHFEEVVADPIGLISRIYQHFDIELTPQARQAMEQFLAANPQGKHGAHTYTLEDFGMNPKTDFEPFRGYCERFGVASVIC